mgnify:CR=1 FL=1
MKTFLKDATILSVFDFQKGENKLLGNMLTGIVIKDETNRFSAEQRVITSTIESQYQFEYTTKSGNTYVSNDEPEKLDISFVELVVMRYRLHSPSEILEMRQALKLADDRIMH